MSWREKREHAIFLVKLAEVNKWATNCIANGDMDFDNIVYRTRDASAVLLEIFGEEES